MVIVLYERDMNTGRAPMHKERSKVSAADDHKYMVERRRED